ncbi:uncharacterized protein LOC119224428 [Pungitius pungitius]|uniref:uncharacterized protein LOC119224428 n=1 Tax=Pungitius pungitius TaxID=134920 RepID=UPI002E13C0E0
MSSVQCLREFVNQRLSAAAEEIFGVFKRTIVEYQEEIERQRGMLDVILRPEVRLNRIELPQSRVCKQEEVLSDQQLCLQERNPSMDQEDPDPPQIKEEQEELCSSQEGEQLEPKQETDTFTLTPTCEETDHSDDETPFLNPDKRSGPVYIQDMVKPYIPTHTCCSASARLLVPPSLRAQHFDKKTLCCPAPTWWNKLSEDDKTAESQKNGSYL